MTEGFSNLEPGAIAAIGFVALVVLLLVWSVIHAQKRKKALDELAPRLGLQPQEPPAASDVLPDLLFHPGGFESAPDAWGKWGMLRSRVLNAWSATLAGRSVLVMDVSQDRQRTDVAGQKDDSLRDKQINSTLIRWDPGPGGPPDFLVREYVLFKGQVTGQRTIRGSEQIGEHYFVFSDASDAELERWITPELQDALTRHRLWIIAAHDGVLFLTRGSSQQQADELPSFLSDGETLLGALVSALRR